MATFFRLLRRCIPLGYTEADIRLICDDPELSPEIPLSDEGMPSVAKAMAQSLIFIIAWTRIFPRLKPNLDDRKSVRLTEEAEHARHHRYMRRTGTIIALYRERWSKIPPRSLVFYPEDSELLDLECIADFLTHCDTEADEDFKTRVATVLDGPAIESWAAKRKAKILSTFPNHSSVFSSTPTFQLPPVLRLATSVFIVRDDLTCSDSPRLEAVYGEELFAWRPARRFGPPLPAFDPIAHAMVLAMLDRLGLSSETTVEELNQINSLFVCMDCPIENYTLRHEKDEKPRFGRPARSWRLQVRFISIYC